MLLNKGKEVGGRLYPWALPEGITHTGCQRKRETAVRLSPINLPSSAFICFTVFFSCLHKIFSFNPSVFQNSAYLCVRRCYCDGNSRGRTCIPQDKDACFSPSGYQSYCCQFSLVLKHQYNLPLYEHSMCLIGCALFFRSI